MITDPDDPGYRYPRPGERLWHEPWGCWIEITGPVSEGLVDEVAGVVASTPSPREGCGGGTLHVGAVVGVKLRSLVDGSHIAHVINPDGVTPLRFVQRRR